MPYRTIKGKRIFFYTPSPEHPSGHGMTNELDNNHHVAGIKMLQAKERYRSNMNRKTAMSYEKAKDKYDKLHHKVVLRGS